MAHIDRKDGEERRSTRLKRSSTPDAA
jgi:hypothetical protein